MGHHHEKRRDRYFVFSGEKPLLVASTKDEVDALLYGMALSYAMLTDKMLDEIRKEAEGWEGPPSDV